MNATSGRTCLLLALLSLALAAALSTGLNTGHDGVTAHAHLAGMQLQGSPETDEGATASADDASDKVAPYVQRDAYCPSTKPELVFARSDDRQPSEGKAFNAPNDEIQLKSRD